jgi:hypothetical protein
MGIRIKKVLCYALSDVKVKNFRIVDSRFQPWVNDEDEIYDRPQRMFRPFLDWIMDDYKEQEQLELLATANGPNQNDKYGITWGILCKAREFFKLSEEERTKNFEEMFHINFVHQKEYGIPSIFGIIPPENPKWMRRDDLLDYYEAGGVPKCKVKWLDRFSGIYPHNMMIKKPHAENVRLPDCVADFELPFSISNNQTEAKVLPARIMGGDYNRLTGRFYPKASSIVGIEKTKEMDKAYRCDIFPSILLWTHYVGLFTDWTKTVNELRPCIYTYWS